VVLFTLYMIGKMTWFGKFNNRWAKNSNGNIVYKTGVENKKRKTEQKRKEIKTIFTDSTKDTIEQLEKVYVYGIGYPEWINIWEQARTIDSVKAKDYLGKAKKTNENILAEYIRILQENPIIVENDAKTLLEVMVYCHEHLEQKTIGILTCRRIRLYIEIAYKRLIENNKMQWSEKQEWDSILDKTKHITTG